VKVVQFLTRKFIGIPIIALITALLFAGVASATIGFTVPVSHHVIITEVPPPPPPPPTPTYTFELFESDNTTPLGLPIQWTFQVGSQQIKTIIVKNTGNQTFSVTVDNSTVPAGFTLTASAVTGLAPGGTATMTLTLQATTAGTYDFTTNFRSEY
jgi:hypothetical protein